MMWGRIRAGRTYKRLLAGAIVITFLAFSGVVEASSSHIEGTSEILAAGSSPVSTVIKQAVGRSVSLLMMAVVIIVAVPLVIAGLALSASYVICRIGRRTLTSGKDVPIPDTKLSNKLTGYQVPG